MSSKTGIAQEFHKYLKGKIGEQFTSQELAKVYKLFKDQDQFRNNENVPKQGRLCKLLIRHHWIEKCFDDDQLYTYGDGRNPKKKAKELGLNMPPRRRQTSYTRAVDQHLAFPQRLIDDALLNLPTRDSPDRIKDKKNLSSELYQAADGRLCCELCKVVCPTEQMKAHYAGRKHRVQVLIAALKSKEKQLMENKEGIEVSCQYDADNTGTISASVERNQKLEIDIQMKNTCEENVTFAQCELLKRVKVYRLDDKMGVTDMKQCTIPPGTTYSVKVTAKPRQHGRYNTPLALLFTKENDKNKTIHIVRNLHLHCCNSNVQKAIKSEGAYKHPKRASRVSRVTSIIDGFPLPEIDKSGYRLKEEIRLQPYVVNPLTRDAMKYGLKEENETLTPKQHDQIKQIKDSLSSGLSAFNYNKRFGFLLDIEEIQMDVDIRKYDMNDASITRCRENRRLLTLQVPGLAEKRPSVLRGDHLFVRIKKGDNMYEDVEYKGYVHAVLRDEVHLGFSDKLMTKYADGMKFSVRFVFNRYPLRMQHRAVELVVEHSLTSVMFPTEFGSRPDIQPPNTALRFYDQKLEKNVEQAMAVRHIVSGTSRPSPYLIFGPPGTGKTVTIVEAMKQVIRCIPKARILACAPSNSAADLLAKRLLNHEKNMLRINAPSRDVMTIPENIRSVCNWDAKNRCYFYPSKEDLEAYKVLVCTLVTAGRLASANFPPDHFTHVFIDECGQALEPEAAIAIAGIIETQREIPDGGQVVLAGDPKQLGPVLRSPISIKEGLGLSLLERLMTKVPIYQKQPSAEKTARATIHEAKYNPAIITKLVKSYRSHPDILKVPNQLFYDNELESHADEIVRNSLQNWTELPQKGFPVIFHGVTGKDEQELRSPSFFNTDEVQTVLNYVEKLLEKGDGKGVDVKPRDISIISPYRKQVQKIKKGLEVIRKNNKHLATEDVRLGSVEEFQGQENLVVIISTVRSSPEYLQNDKDYKIGFLSNPKRMNVALTRAKALLIVVGNPYVLSVDPHWGEFIKFVLQKGGYSGCDFEPENDRVEEIIQQFSIMKLNDLAPIDTELMTSQKELVEEPRWDTDK